MAQNREKLFDQFSPVSQEEWRAQVEKDLKGADFQKKLVWRTNEGFNVQPMYRLDDIKDLKTTDSLPGEYPFVRGVKSDNDWFIRQDICVCDVKEANAKALDVLNKGVNSVGFNLKGEITKDQLAALLDGIVLSAVEVNFKCCPKQAPAFVATLADYVCEQGCADTFVGSVDFNPFKRALKHGQPIELEVVELAKQVLAAAKPVKKLRVLAVDTTILCNAGAFISQELGYALSWGAQWLTALTDAGLSADEVAKKIKFNMGISTTYFMEMAKFRAARMLWAQIVKQYQPACECSCKMIVNAVTSEFNQTIYDAYVNLLRSQTEAMSAALAGVHSITVTPFDKQYKNPDDFSERLARNQQLLLKEETHLDKVVDPAGGSYYVETLTVAIAQEAWKTFLATEDKGGFLAAVNNGEVQKDVNAAAQTRLSNVAKRKETLLGSNQFPNFNEMAADKIVAEPACGCGGGTPNTENALNTKRAASDFEELRLATERSGKRPKVFMLTIGNLAMRLARSQFSANFFACAGYEIIDNLGFNTVEEGVDQALAKNADIVVLCSSDDEYAELAPKAFQYLNGKAEFVVAGAPACTDDLKAVGIENFVHVRCNVLDTLKAFSDKLLK